MGRKNGNAITSKRSDMVRVTRQVESTLREVVRQRGLGTHDGRRANGILASGSTHMSGRVLTGLIRSIGSLVN